MVEKINKTLLILSLLCLTPAPVVANQYGIFVSYLHGQSEGYNKYHWKLLRSTDGGSSFATVYESPHLIGTNPPVIETDNQGRIYLAHPDWSSSANPTYFFGLPILAKL